MKNLQTNLFFLFEPKIKCFLYYEIETVISQPQNQAKFSAAKISHCFTGNLKFYPKKKKKKQQKFSENNVLTILN